MRQGPVDDKSVILEMFGQVYRLRADDPDVDARAVVEYVHSKVAEQERVHGDLPTHKLIVLTILNVARDYVLARERLSGMEDALAHRVRHLVARIDAAVSHAGEDEKGKEKPAVADRQVSPCPVRDSSQFVEPTS